MALEMRETIGALIEKWQRLGHDLGFWNWHRAWICHAWYHRLRGSLRLRRNRDGVECRIATVRRSQAWSILISPRVLMAVEAAVTTEPVGEFTLKGIRLPMAAHNVLAAIPPKNLN